VGEFSYVKFPQDIVHQKLFKSIQFLPIISTYKGILLRQCIIILSIVCILFIYQLLIFNQVSK